ncbi:MAG: hypothetical protein JW936_03670 [Sedimentisphaerales bacterium]|nr:hypothetical protein [Sedimentisphaerales bacterium]
MGYKRTRLFSAIGTDLEGRSFVLENLKKRPDEGIVALGLGDYKRFFVGATGKLGRGIGGSGVGGEIAFDRGAAGVYDGGGWFCGIGVEKKPEM